MLIPFDLEIDVVTLEGSFDCLVSGSATAKLEDYGSDRDGNRGRKEMIVSSIEIELIKAPKKFIQWSEVRNSKHVMDCIRDYVLEKAVL